jgi:hypothetical protein
MVTVSNAKAGASCATSFDRETHSEKHCAGSLLAAMHEGVTRLLAELLIVSGMSETIRIGDGC